MQIAIIAIVALVLVGVLAWLLMPKTVQAEPSPEPINPDTTKKKIAGIDEVGSKRQPVPAKQDPYGIDKALDEIGPMKPVDITKIGDYLKGFSNWLRGK